METAERLAKLAQMEQQLAMLKTEAQLEAMQSNLAKTITPPMNSTPILQNIPFLNQPINPETQTNFNPANPDMITKRQAAYEVVLASSNMAKFGIGVTIGFVAVAAMSLISSIVAAGFAVFCIAGCAYITKVTQNDIKKLKDKYRF